MGLVALVLADITGSSKAGRIQLDGQVALSQFLGPDIADEGEAVAVLEVGLGNDVAFKSRSRPDAVVAAAAESEDELRTARNWRRRGERGRRSASAWGGSVVVQDHGTSLSGSPVWIGRRICDCYARVKPCSVRNERETAGCKSKA